MEAYRTTQQPISIPWLLLRTLSRQAGSLFRITWGWICSLIRYHITGLDAATNRAMAAERLRIIQDRDQRIRELESTVSIQQREVDTMAMVIARNHQRVVKETAEINKAVSGDVAK